METLCYHVTALHQSLRFYTVSPFNAYFPPKMNRNGKRSIAHIGNQIAILFSPLGLRLDKWLLNKHIEKLMSY